MYALINKLSLISRSTLCRNTFNHLSRDFSNVHSSSNISNILKSLTTVNQLQTRTIVSGFFNKHTATEIWKGVSGVSRAGQKRGRGKVRGKKVIRDLNKGQVIGIGKANIRFPGLSAPILRGREVVERQQLPEDTEFSQKLYQIRDASKMRKRQRISPLDRGWSGGRPAGRKIGPPSPIGDLKFEGFDTIVLVQRPVFHMTKKTGWFRQVQVMCLTGNKNGLIGFALATKPFAQAALERAKNRAGQKLMYVERYDNYTVMHDFFARFGNSKISVWRKPRGYGLNCHRVIKAICEMAGITDLYVKVEGGDSTMCIAQAFIIGLLRQKTYKELAEETNLHVVEFSADNDFYPKLLASPSNPIESAEEIPDLNLHVWDNRVFHFKKKYPPSYTRRAHYPIDVRKQENLRSHFDTKIALRAEYGDLKSFLSDTYPECKPFLPRWSKVIREAKKREEAEGEAAE